MNPTRLTFAVLLLLVSSAAAQTPYPMVMSLKPTAAQAGTTSEHTVTSRYNLYGAYQVLVTGEGVTGEVVAPEPPKDGKTPNLQSLKVKFSVAPDAMPGVRDFRLATPQGASTLGQLVVVRDPVVYEQAKNNTPDEAQQIEVPSTACGAIERAEDVDYFKFRVEAGAALNFHVRSMRLQNKIHDLQQHSDPILTLRNATGGTLAASDNAFYGDPLLGYRFEQAGEYLLEIRDVRYQGNQYWQYSIEISDRPLVTQVHPLGVRAGEPAELQMVGLQLPDVPVVALDVPSDLQPGSRWLRLPLGDEKSNPVPVVVSDLPAVLESAEANDEPAAAQAVAAPCGISGRIETPGDVDCYAFEAKKGERFSFEVVARRRQSELDAHLRILNAEGRQLTLNDDLRWGKHTFADSAVENWAAPADGKYVIEVRDLHLRGGPPFVYFLRVTRSEPYFQLWVDTDKTQLTPGTSGVFFVRVTRQNGFAGEVQLEVEGLPEGVTADCGRILAGRGQDACIVLSAAADAPQGAANIRITGRAVHEAEGAEPLELSAVAVPYQETYQPGGGRGHWPVEMHTVSVGAKSDLLGVKLSTTELTLKPGESQKIEVEITRSEGYNKNVTLDVQYRHLSGVYGNSLPEGVTLDAGNSKTLLTGTATKGHITLKAAANAPPVEKQQIAVMANVSINFVMKATYSSAPVAVTVAAP